MSFSNAAQPSSNRSQASVILQYNACVCVCVTPTQRNATQRRVRRRILALLPHPNQDER